MDDLISRSELMAAIKRQYCTDCDSYDGLRCRACHADDMMDLVDDSLAVDAVEVVRCKDCIYFRERHIRLPDGSERDYAEGEGWVDIDVGVNVGNQCRREEKWVYRHHSDYCSRGVRKEDAHEQSD